MKEPNYYCQAIQKRQNHRYFSLKKESYKLGTIFIQYHGTKGGVLGVISSSLPQPNSNKQSSIFSSLPCYLSCPLVSYWVRPVADISKRLKDRKVQEGEGMIPLHSLLLICSSLDAFQQKLFPSMSQLQVKGSSSMCITRTRFQ